MLLCFTSFIFSPKEQEVYREYDPQYDEQEHWKNGQFRIGRKLADEVKKEVEKVRAQAVQKTEGDPTAVKFPNPTKGQVDIITAIERNAAKVPFDCMIRSIYVTDKDAFNGNNIGGMIGCLRQYNSSYLNGFKPGFKTDISDERKDATRIFPFLKSSNEKKVFHYRKDIFHAYKLRSFFEWPFRLYKDKPYVLTTEELATIFHFPSGMVTQTPTLGRIGSKKSEAPANLPI